MKKSRSIKTIVKTYIRDVLYFFPIRKNKIVFLNFDGKGYGDNPKYIAEEFLRQNVSCKMVWLVRDGSYVPSCIKEVDIDGLMAFYELSTAKIIISNCKSNIPFYYIKRKKKNQYYLQTWHGDFGPKYIEKEIEEVLPPDYVAASKADSAITDAIISGNKWFTSIIKESFWLPEQCNILEYGAPRNDVYFRGVEQKNILRQKFGFSLDEKILLYAPTFRDNGDVSSYNIDFERLRQCLNHLHGEEWKIVIKLHPNSANIAGLFRYNDSIIEGSSFEDQQELCMISDCLITDYSSIMADFMLMSKPVFLYVPDLEKYSDRTTGRGLRDLYFRLPFSLSRNQEELEARILEFNSKEYVEKLDAFMKVYYNTFDDGHASERVVNHLKGIMGG
jgi:CDP-glycerol glycerophosphotransferase